MTIMPLHSDPMQMTARARIYLVLTMLQHLLLGLACLLSPELFKGRAYVGIKQAMPGPEHSDMVRWGVLFVCTALMCAVAAWRAEEGVARWALLASVCTTALLAGGFIFVQFNGTPAPTGLLGWLSLTAKDLVVLRQPLRSPFEALTNRVLADAPNRR